MEIWWYLLETVYLLPAVYLLRTETVSILSGQSYQPGAQK